VAAVYALDRYVADVAGDVVGHLGALNASCSATSDGGISLRPAWSAVIAFRLLLKTFIFVRRPLGIRWNFRAQCQGIAGHKFAYFSE
jgi:hypothetical protein